MDGVSDQMKWIRTGKQRTAIVNVLRKPATQLELLRLAQKQAPNLQLGDVWGIFQEGIERGVFECLNPGEPTGKVFFYTDAGRQAVADAFGVHLDVPPAIDWHCYGRVIRAKVRRLVLLQVAHNGPGAVERNTATFIRQQLSQPHKLAINTVIRALHQLVHEGLLFARISKEGRRVFMLSEKGRQIAEQIDRPILIVEERH